MNAKSHVTRVIFAIASLVPSALMIGSVLALADHYGEQAQMASVRPHVVAQR